MSLCFPFCNLHITSEAGLSCLSLFVFTPLFLCTSILPSLSILPHPHPHPSLSLCHPPTSPSVSDWHLPSVLVPYSPAGTLERSSAVPVQSATHGALRGLPGLLLLLPLPTPPWCHRAGARDASRAEGRFLPRQCSANPPIRINYSCQPSSQMASRPDTFI